MPATRILRPGSTGVGRGDAIAVAPRVFLDQHRVGPFGHRRAGENAHRLAGAAGAGKSPPGRGFADDLQRSRPPRRRAARSRPSPKAPWAAGCEARRGRPPKFRRKPAPAGCVRWKGGQWRAARIFASASSTLSSGFLFRFIRIEALGSLPLSFVTLRVRAKIIAGFAAGLFGQDHAARCAWRGRRLSACRKWSGRRRRRRSAPPSPRRFRPQPWRAALTRNPGRVSSGAMSTSTLVRASGWQSGNQIDACAWRRGFRRCARWRTRRPFWPARTGKAPGFPAP